MVELNDYDVNNEKNSQNFTFIADVHPDYKKAFGILQNIFHNSFYNQRTDSFDAIKYSSYKRTAQIIVCKYGIEALEYLEENILENDPRFGALYAMPSAVLNFVKENIKEIEYYKNKKELQNQKSVVTIELINDKNEIYSKNILSQLIPNIQENNRVIPNAFLRSSLFGIVKKGKRELVKEKKIVSLSQYKIYFTGEELDQLDLVVWDSLVYLFKRKTNDKEKTYLSLYEILASMGYKNDRKVRQQVKERIQRLTYANVKVETNKSVYIGSLIYSFKLDNENEFYCLRMNKDLIDIFSCKKDYTYINIVIRSELGQNQLAIWLYHFFASHENPIPYKISYLRELSRSNSEQKEFNRKLKVALEIIKKAYEMEKIKFDYKIQNSELHVTKLKNVLKIR
jgi:hypothetical protein